MNSAEQENSINRQENLPHREAAETQTPSEFNKELEGLLNNHKKERLNSVNTDVDASLHGAEHRLDNAASLGYKPEEVARLAAERGVESRLAENQQSIRELGMQTTQRLEAVAPREQVENRAERERIMEQFQEKRGNMLTNFMSSEMASNSLDLVPFAGSGKMIVESIAGKTLAGKKLTGKDRIIHGAIGAGSLALDFTGIGEAKNVAIIAGKSVGLVEKVGVKLAERGALKSAKVFEITSKFMAEHPQLVAHAEQFAEAKLREGIKSIKDYRQQAA